MNRSLAAAPLALLLGCAPAPAPDYRVPSVPMPSAKASPDARDGGAAKVVPEADAGPPAAARGACLAREARKSGSVASLALAGDRLSFCLEARWEKQPIPRECWDVDLASGAYSPAPSDRPTDRVDSAASHPGGPTLEARATEVVVCKPGKTDCATLRAQGFKGAGEAFPEALREAIPADLSPDGGRALLVRHEGGASEKVFGEVYDVASKRRVARFPIQADEYVLSVAWLGKRTAVIETCVSAGPGCGAHVIDPTTGKKGLYLTNVVAMRHPVLPLKGSQWAIVGDAGREVVVLDAETGRKVRSFNVSVDAELEAGAGVARRSDHELAIVYAGPKAATVVVVDTERGGTSKVLVPPPPRCP